jgi:multisubunit Na+/H+ antiporter MnhB subunit
VITQTSFVAYSVTGITLLFTLTAILSAALFALCRWRRWRGVIAIAAAVAWIAFLMPAFPHFRSVDHEFFYNPLTSEDYFRAIVAFAPVLFSLLELCRRRTPAV